MWRKFLTSSSVLALSHDITKVSMHSRLIMFIELRFYVPSTQNRSFHRRSPSQSLGLVIGMEKLNLTQQKHTFTNQKKCTTTQNKHKTKLKPGLVASYDIQPGNGENLFLFRRFINCHLLTYLLTHPFTAPGPTRSRLIIS